MLNGDRPAHTIKKIKVTSNYTFWEEKNSDIVPYNVFKSKGYYEKG